MRRNKSHQNYVYPDRMANQVIRNLRPVIATAEPLEEPTPEGGIEITPAARAAANRLHIPPYVLLKTARQATHGRIELDGRYIMPGGEFAAIVRDHALVDITIVCDCALVSTVRAAARGSL